MSLDFILEAGPLVRASSWEPTAARLRAAGHHVQTPDLLAHQSTPPRWRDWNAHLMKLIAPGAERFLVGHSSASVLVADLATKLPCKGLIMVDGEVPPILGAARPVRPALHEFIKTLAAPEGTLPIWSRWLADPARASLVGLDQLARDPAALADFENGLRRFTVDWFDDAIELCAWDHVPAGYTQTSALYDHAAAEARRRNWPVIQLCGTHLHPTLRPNETSDALVDMARRLFVNLSKAATPSAK
jgi:alpha-beta hydrolase superfamily lysophospholipase